MLSEEKIREIMDDMAGGNPDRYFSYTSTTIELCRVEPEKRHDFIPLYAAPVVRPDMVKAVKALLEKLPQPGSRNWPHFYAMAELKAVHDMVAAAEKEQR